MSGRSRVPVFAFPFVKIRTRSSCRYVRLVAGTCFRFSDRKNRNAGAAAAGVSGWSHVPECFRFSACKNRNAGAAVPAANVPAAGAFLPNTSLAVSAFSIANAGAAVAGVSGWSHVPECFRFSACKNRNAEAAVPAAGAFLSNTSLAVFAFSIANAGAAAAGVSGWSHVPVFAFPIVKIVMRGQQVCQAGRRYLFSIFWSRKS